MLVNVLLSVLPLFLIMLIGYFASRSAKFGAGAEPAISAFVFYIALPALLFKVVAEAPLDDGIPLSFPIIVIVSCSAFTAFNILISRLLLRQTKPKALQYALSSGYGNVAYLGVPVVIGLVGSQAGLAAGIGQLTHNLYFMLLYPMLFPLLAGGQSHGSNGAKIKAAVDKAILKNPVVWGIAAGLLVALAKIELPAPVVQTTDLLAGAAAPGALFAIGLTLSRTVKSLNEGRISVLPLITGTASKLLALPLLTVAIAGLLPPMPEDWYQALILMAAMPTSATAFILAQAEDENSEATATTIVLTSGLAIITIPVISMLFLT